MNEEQVNEAMRLASLMATARCVRVSARKKGPVEAAQAELRVAKATQALRKYLEGVKT